ncbi:MAG: hypothetical protein NTW87_06195, partial [Planctomycetota bacterium]|nr:hypothetical protein [Planctomycetota bacterium]
FVRESRNGRMSPARGGDVALRVNVGDATLFDASVPVDENGACVFEQLIDADTPDGVLSVCRPKTPGSSEKDAVKPLCAVRGGEMAARSLRLELPLHPCVAGSRAKGRVMVESASGVPLAGVPVRVQAAFHGYGWEQDAPLPFGDDLVRAAKPTGAALKGWESDQELLSGSNGEAEFELELPESQNSVAVVTARASGAGTIPNWRQSRRPTWCTSPMDPRPRSNRPVRR